MNIPHLRQVAWTHYWAVALVGASCLLYGVVLREQRLASRGAALEKLVSDFTYSAEEQATEAFAAGDFRRAAALLAPAGASPSASTSSHLLHARTLECLGRFSDAAEAYDSVDEVPAARLAALQGRKFSQRMASERNPGSAASREQLYRLHAELMRRGDAATARLIARRLLPDVEPMRDSMEVLLRQWDREARVELSAERGRLDVAVRCVEPQVMELLRDLEIDTLSVSRAGLDAPRTLAGLGVRALDLSHNGFSDLAGIRALPLRRLSLHHSRVADLRPLAGMPLRELDLAHTVVESLAPLALCPLQKLNLSATAVRDLTALRGLELRELDLSHTRVADLGPLSGMPLERLNLTDTGVWNLKALAGARLKSLSIAGTAVKDLSPLAGMPLVELDLRGCELVSDVGALASCAGLERIFLPRHIRVPADHWGLPQLQIVQDRGVIEVTPEGLRESHLRASLE